MNITINIYTGFFILLLADVVSQKSDIYKKNGNNHVNSGSSASSYAIRRKNRLVRLQNNVMMISGNANKKWLVD